MKFEVQLEEEGDSEMFEDLARYLKFHPGVARFLFNPAGFIFVVGLFLFLGMVIGWVAIFFIEPPTAGKMLATLLVEVFPGKEASIPLGLALGLHPVIVFGIVTLMDLITASWVYPLFYVFRRRQAGRQTFSGYLFSKMERNAKRHQRFIERYGGWGIFLFMLVPFAVNGPLIGAIIGKLAGVRTRYILPALAGATSLSTGAWTLLWHYAHDQAERIVSDYGGGWIAAGIAFVFALFILKNAIDFWRDVRHFREIQARRRELIRRQMHEQTLFLGESVQVDAEQRGEGDD